MKGRPEETKLISDIQAYFAMKSWENDNPAIASFLSEYWQPMLESQQKTYERYPHEGDIHQIYTKHGKTVYGCFADCWGCNLFGVGAIARLLDMVIQQQEIPVIQLVTEMFTPIDLVARYLGIDWVVYTLFYHSEVGYDNPEMMEKMRNLKIESIVPYLWNGAPTSGIDKSMEHRMSVFMEAVRKNIQYALQRNIQQATQDGFADQLFGGLPLPTILLPCERYPAKTSWRYNIAFWYEGSLTDENVDYVASVIAREEWERCKQFIGSFRAVAEALLGEDAFEPSNAQVKYDHDYDMPMVFYPTSFPDQ